MGIRIAPRRGISQKPPGLLQQIIKLWRPGRARLRSASPGCFRRPEQEEGIRMKQPRNQLRTRVEAGGVYYWPAGQTVWVDEDYEAVEFSPSGPMCEVIDHLNSKLTT
jgi:hypothetical protein